MLIGAHLGKTPRGTTTTSPKAIELAKLAFPDMWVPYAELIDKELKAAFDSGVQRMKKRARYNLDAVPITTCETHRKGFNAGTTEQRKAVDNIILPEWEE